MLESVDLLLLVLLMEEPPTRSELKGESTRGWGERRDLAREMRGEKSWASLLPNSTLAGCEMVSDMDMVTRGIELL